MRRLLLLCVFAASTTLLPLTSGQQHASKWTLGQIEDPPPDAVPCQPLSKELLAQYANKNTVLITVVDRLIMQKFGRSWVKNIEAAGIGYGFVAALDPWTSRVLGHWGIKRCFNAPMEKLQYRGTDANYRWGSGHWAETTWNKVRVVAAVHDLGFHVIHSDTDVTWFQNPMPYFSNYLDGPVHAIFTTDALETQNRKEDQGLEAMTSPHININTGVYFIRHWPGGKKFFEEWFKLKDQGHDQDGLNTLVRGEGHRGETKFPGSHMRPGERLIECALDRSTLVSFLPVSMFGNAYTFVTGQVHKQLSHPLYEIHWVWSGSTMESKQQTIRDAMKFWDPPEYYETPSLVTMDMWVPEPFKDFNFVEFEHTEKMIQFHIYAANAQLRQAYYGFMAAMALDRVFVVPKFQCFCAKNWYMTQSCRINGERHATFPFDCALSHMMRVKKLLHGLSVQVGAQKGSVTIREHTFMSNPNVPDSVKKSRLVLVPADRPRAETDVSTPSPASLREEPQGDGSTRLTVPWPLDDEELRALLEPLKARFRVIHLSNATKIIGRGFHDPVFQKKFDEEIGKLTTHWCCRSPKDQERYNATDKVDLRILPADRDPSAGVFKAVYGIDKSMAGYNNNY